MDFPGEFLIWLIFQSALPALIIFQDWARSGSKRSMIKKSYFWGKEKTGSLRPSVGLGLDIEVRYN